MIKIYCLREFAEESQSLFIASFISFSLLPTSSSSLLPTKLQVGQVSWPGGRINLGTSFLEGFSLNFGSEHLQ